MDSSAHIKADPDGVASPAIDEEDLYEDAGDLEFYDRSEPGDPYGTVYMAKVPKHLWEAWSKLDDDAEIRIGTIRQWYEPRGNAPPDPRLRMLLENRPEHQMIPKEYHLDILSTDSQNIFAFTEEDLPGFKARSKQRQEAAAAGIPMSLLRSKTDKDKVEKPAYEKRNRYQPYYRKAIPKKTKIAARIKYELNCKPVDNEETRRIEQMRAREAMQPKHTIQFLGHGRNGIITHGSAAANDAFSSFIKSTAPAKPAKGKKTELKAARIPENELLDRIFSCFRRYEYWGMRQLKAELQQPEAYLRQVLEKVAELNKTGTFANKWSLQAGHKTVTTGDEAPIAAAAPEMEGAADDEDDVDDDEIKMEDVLPS